MVYDEFMIFPKMPYDFNSSVHPLVFGAMGTRPPNSSLIFMSSNKTTLFKIDNSSITHTTKIGIIFFHLEYY